MSKRSYSTRTPAQAAVDEHVGMRLRQRRVLLGLSQQALGEKLGLTFQQVQKYERGHNRVGASRLYDLARVLEVPVSYFFEGMEGASPAAAEGRDPLFRREAMELVRAFYRIEDLQTRRRLFDLVKAVAGGTAQASPEGRPEIVVERAAPAPLEAPAL